jgi:hypothetical protein
MFELMRSGAANAQAMQVNFNALPDGSFKLMLPEGHYRVVASPNSSGIPPAYFLRSLSYGPADLFKEPMAISAAERSEIQIGFGTTVVNPWVRVSGKVVGGDPALGPYRVALDSRTTSAVETPVNPDGSFEFSNILQNTNYSARLVPQNDAATVAAVNVAASDVSGIELRVPPEREMIVVTTMQGEGAIPAFVMTLAGSGSTMTVLVKPESDGAFKVKLPADERRVRVTGFPMGYLLKSVTYASTDLLQAPLKISDANTPEIRVSFTLDSSLPQGSLRGRVVGIDPERSGVALVLNGASFFSTFEAAVGADGSFSFSRLPQGTYIPTLNGAEVNGLLSPSTITIAGQDLSGVILSVPPGSAGGNRPSRESGQTGVSVANLGGSREAANESAAVAGLRTINTAQVTYLTTNGRFGNLQQLMSAGLLDSSFAGGRGGFSYSVVTNGREYAIVATPSNAGSGQYGFFSTPDGVIRYSAFEMLAPPRQGGNPVQ